MTEPLKPAVAFQGPGQDPAAPSPAPTPAPEGQPPDAAQPLTLTQEEFERRLKEAEDRALARAQSLFDKGQTKVRARLDQLEQSLKGVQIAPEEREKLRQQVINAALTEEDAPPQPSAPAAGQTAQPGQAAPAPEGQDLDPISTEALRMMTAAGVVIEDDDPEAKTIDQSSAYAFLRSVEAAIEAKRRRTAPRTPTSLGGAGSHNPNPISDINDPGELFKIAFGAGK